MRNALTCIKIPSFVESLIFLYFFTLHADLLSFAMPLATLRLSNIIALFLLGFLLFQRTNVFAFEKNLTLGIGAITISLIASTLTSHDLDRSLLFLGWWTFIFLGYIVLPWLIVSSFPLKRILEIYSFSFLAVAGYALLQFAVSLFGIHDPFASQHFLGISRPNAFSYEPSYYALYLTPFMVITNLKYLMNRGSKWTVLFVNGAYLLSMTTSAVLGYIAFGGVALIFAKKELKRKLLGFFGKLTLAIVGLALIFPSVWKHLVMKFAFEGLSHHSFYERWVGIVNCYRMFIEFPLFGVGLGAIPSTLFEAWASQSHAYQFLYPYRLSSAVATLNNPLKLFEPTNVFFEILGSLGLVGILAFGFFLISYFRLAKKTLFSEEAFLFFVSTLTMLIVLQFNQGLFRTYIWAHLAIGISVMQLTLKSKATHD